jgi:hypothetical protein
MSAYIHYNLIPLILLWPDGSSTMQVGFIQSDIARELNTSNNNQEYKGNQQCYK